MSTPLTRKHITGNIFTLSFEQLLFIVADHRRLPRGSRNDKTVGELLG